MKSHYPQIKNLDELNKTVFEDYKTYIVSELGREWGWRSELSCIKAIIRRFVRGGFADKEVKECFEELERPPIRQLAFEIIPESQLKQLVKYVQGDELRFYGPMYFIARMGWRISETLSIVKKNIRWDKGKPISIKLVWEDRKGNHEFIFDTIDSRLAKVIQEYARKNPTSKWLFPNTNGNLCKDDTLRDYIKKVSNEVLGRTLKPHDFRRSLVTMAGQANVPARNIMAITGHRDLETLLKHYQFSTEQGRRSVMKLTKF